MKMKSSIIFIINKVMYETSDSGYNETTCMFNLVTEFRRNFEENIFHLIVLILLGLAICYW